jgi:glycosyltransferase involved in cell wall biosynthesis
MDLSIVIPTFREAHKVQADVLAASRFLASHGLTGELIIADDGSPDATADRARAVPVPPGIDLRILDLPHRGKGAAVREGIRASRGDYVMFADSGVCVPFEDVLPMLEALRAGDCDIAHGSRKLRASVIRHRQSLKRRLLSWLFRKATLLYLHLPRTLTDTQCGFKAYRGDIARELYTQAVTDGFMFDLEVLMRARRAGYRVKEFPVRWAWDPDSRLKPSAILGNTISDLRKLKKRLAGEQGPPTGGRASLPASRRSAGASPSR